MEKNLNTKIKNQNLLSDNEFVSFLQFEADYASIIKGGHFPYYLGKEKQQRLTSDINILSTKEQKEVVYNLFISKN